MRTESRERGPALLTCTDEEGGTSCRRKNWGDDLFRREKPLDVRARSRPFFARVRARPGTVHAGKISCKHSSAKQHRCRRSLAEKHNFLSLVVRWKVMCALALVPFCPRAPRRDCNRWCNSPFIHVGCLETSNKVWYIIVYCMTSSTVLYNNLQ